MSKDKILDAAFDLAACKASPEKFNKYYAKIRDLIIEKEREERNDIISGAIFLNEKGDRMYSLEEVLDFGRYARNFADPTQPQYKSLSEVIKEWLYMKRRG